MSNEARYRLVAQDRGQRAFKSFRKGLGGIDKFIGRSLMPQLAAVAGVAGFGAMVKSTLDAADKVHKLNQRLGVSTEALSEYQHVANLSGVEFGKMTTGIQRMTRRIAEAARGSGPARDALQELGLEAGALAELKADQQFEAIADAMQGVTNEGDRVRLAMKLFDSEGVSLIQTMGDGAEGIREMREEARRLGLALSQDQANAAAKAKDAMAKVEAATKGLTQQIAISLGPAIANVADWMAEKLPKAIEWSSGAFHALQRASGEALGGMLDSYADLLDVFARLPNMLGGEEFEKNANRYRFYAEQARGWGDAIEVATGKAGEWENRTGKVNDKLEHQAQIITETALPAYQAANDQLQNMNAKLEISVERLGFVSERVNQLGDVMSDDMVASVQFAAGHVRRFADDAGSWLATVATQGSSAAGKFANVWRSAIDSIIADLARMAAKFALFRALDALPIGGGGFGTLLNLLSGGPGLSRSVAPAGGGVGAPAPASQLVFVNNSLAPATAADRLNAYQRVNDLQRQAQPYTVAG